MKKDLKKLVVILLFGAVALGGCAVGNRGHRGPNDRNHGRYDRNRGRDHHYNNY